MTFVVTNESWLPVRDAVVECFDLDNPDNVLLRATTDKGGVATFESSDISGIASGVRYFFRPDVRRASNGHHNGVLRLNQVQF